MNEIINSITNYAQSNTGAAVAAGFLMLVLLIRRTKLFFILLAIAIAGVGIMKIFDKISATGL